MTASANVLQMVRAHYRRDDSAFAAAAMAIARGAKVTSTREQILDVIRDGVATARRAGQPQRPAEPMRPAPLAQSNNMLEALPPVTFESLQLDAPLQLFLDELVVELEYRDDLAARNLRARNRFLFHGPPGNGKTSSAAALANALDLPAYAVSLPQTISKYIGATAENLGKIFASLSENSVVVFDELDALATHRGNAEQAAGKEFNGIVNALLTLMDRNRRGVIVATTNRPDIIDPAVLRRFDEQIEFPAPNERQLRSLADRLADKFQIPPVDSSLIGDCVNYDAVTKAVEREARRIVMKEILAAEAAGEEAADGSEEEAAE